MRTVSLIIAILWLSPLLLMFVGVLASLIFSSAREWLQAHLFGRDAQFMPATTEAPASHGYARFSSVDDEVAGRSADLAVQTQPRTTGPVPPNEQLIASQKKEDEHGSRIGDCVRLRLRAENYRSMAYASKDHDVKSVLLESARELDELAARARVMSN
jgi:hypothetical protein